MKLAILLLFLVYIFNVTASYNYTFYNDEGLLVLIGEPKSCYPYVGTVSNMWRNQTFYCDNKLYEKDSFIFEQLIQYFPYLKVFVCNIHEKQQYYYVSNCNYGIYFRLNDLTYE